MNYRRVFIPNSAVFITIVTSRRRKLLIKNIAILREAFKFSIQKYKYSILAISVLEDHLHMIIKPKEIHDYPFIVKDIKIQFSKNLDTSQIKDYTLSASKLMKNEKDIWQRRYYEHTIKDEEDFYRHVDYIHFNSLKHYNIAPKNWPFSTFKTFLMQGFYDENWCNFDNKYKIDKLNYE